MSFDKFCILRIDLRIDCQLHIKHLKGLHFHINGTYIFLLTNQSKYCSKNKLYSKDVYAILHLIKYT